MPTSKVRYRVAELSMADMKRLHACQGRLQAVCDAIGSTNLAAKSALLRLCSEAFDDIAPLFRRGVLGALAARKAGREIALPDDRDFLNHFIEVAKGLAAPTAGTVEQQSQPAGPESGS